MEWDVFVAAAVVVGSADDRPPRRRPPIPPETPGFNETTTGFKFLLQKTRETANFRPSFTETVHKKKKKWAVSPTTKQQ